MLYAHVAKQCNKRLQIRCISFSLSLFYEKIVTARLAQSCGIGKILYKCN